MTDSSGDVGGDSRYEEGLGVRRSVLGEDYVKGATGGATPFDRPFQKFITEGAWGSVWSRPDITKRERSMITIALLAALGHEDELALHIRASKNTGTRPEDIREALLHVAVYGGVPAANKAMKIAKANRDDLAAMADMADTADSEEG